MSDSLDNNYFTKEYSCKDLVEDKGSGEYVISGNTDAPDGTMVLYWAANPPNYMTNFSGSGLPFPCPEMAFDNTPNKGAVKVVDGSFKFNIHYPNSFYAGHGNNYIEPHIYYRLCGDPSIEHKVNTIKIGEGIPYRTLSYPQNILPNVNKGVYFYDGEDTLPIRTQENILRDSAYPSKNITHDNFWGLKVPR